MAKHSAADQLEETGYVFEYRGELSSLLLVPSSVPNDIAERENVQMSLYEALAAVLNDHPMTWLELRPYLEKLDWIV